MSYTVKPFEELDIMDDFLMNATAGDREVGEEFCRTLLKGLLQRELGQVQISIQKVIFANAPNQRGIRLDIEVEELELCEKEIIVKNIFNIEPNKRKEVNLPKHNRFYQAKIDSRNLKSGETDFIKLPNLFVITITDYDPFGYDYMMYTVHNQCQEIPDLEYEDGLFFIYFNTTGTKGGNSSIKSLLNFIQNSKINNVTDEITHRLHNCISKVKVSPELREAYMRWEEKLFYERLDGKMEGKIEGKIEDILELLEEFGVVPEELKELILKETDLEKLKKWHKLAAKVTSIEEFIENM